MNSKVLIGIGILALAAVVGIATYSFWPKPIPKFQVADGSGQPIGFDELFGDKDFMLIVFLVPNCPATKFSSGIVNQEHAAFSDRMSFVGLLFGNNSAGQQYAKSENLTFPIYGLRDAPDPFAVQELIHIVGRSHGLGSAVYGGTIVVVDRQGKIAFQLEKEEVRNLPKRLGVGGSS